MAAETDKHSFAQIATFFASFQEYPETSEAMHSYLLKTYDPEGQGDIGGTTDLILDTLNATIRGHDLAGDASRLFDVIAAAGLVPETLNSMLQLLHKQVADPRMYVSVPEDKNCSECGKFNPCVCPRVRPILVIGWKPMPLSEMLKRVKEQTGMNELSFHPHADGYIVS